MRIGITMGDSSGVGPEIILKTFVSGEIRQPSVVFGDLAVLDYCNRLLRYDVPLRQAKNPQDLTPGQLNVIDFGLLSEAEITPGRISRASGRRRRAPGRRRSGRSSGSPIGRHSEGERRSLSWWTIPRSSSTT